VNQGFRKARARRAPGAAASRLRPAMDRLAPAAALARQGVAHGRELLRAWWAARRAPKPKIINPYVNTAARWRLFMKIVFPLLLGLFCLVYGFYFALTAPYLVIAFAAPVGLLVLLAVWALPASATAPMRTTEFLFCSVIVSLILWPNYLALSLPGLPWITMIRLTGIPMTLLFLVSLSISERVRGELATRLESTPPIWTILLVFVAAQFLTVPFAKSISGAFNKALIQQVNWTAMFLLAVYFCRVPGRAHRFIALTLAVFFPILVISAWEGEAQQLLWSDNVPSFLKIDDPVAASLLGSHVRGATGLYRVKATFSTALGLAEFAGLLTPFAIHYAVGPYSKRTKVLGLLTLPLLFYVVRLTDARLGVVCYLASFLLYSMLWALLRFRRKRGDLVSATIVYSYPTLAGLLLLAVSASHRLSTMILGGGAQESSNQAREHQLIMGVPKILQNPIGHGSGGAGEAMGYGAGQFVTVDNYYLTLGLDLGVLGLTAFLALFLTGIGYAVRYGLAAATMEDDELLLLIPLASCLSAFLIEKSVFSQPDNHPLYFMMLGMIVALSYRVIQTMRKPGQEAP
jgi:hypothetical protein